MNDWLAARSPRERLMLGLMGLALAAFALWYGLYAPLLAARDRAQASYEAAVQAQTQVKRTVTRIKALRVAVKPPQVTASPEDAIRTSAEAAGLSLARVEPDPAGGLRVAIDAAPATALFPWLAGLQRDYGLAAQTLTVVKGEEGGLRVDATLVAAGG